MRSNSFKNPKSNKKKKTRLLSRLFRRNKKKSRKVSPNKIKRTKKERKLSLFGNENFNSPEVMASPESVESPITPAIPITNQPTPTTSGLRPPPQSKSPKMVPMNSYTEGMGPRLDELICNMKSEEDCNGPCKWDSVEKKCRFKPPKLGKLTN